MALTNMVGIGSLVIFIYMTLAFLLAMWRKDNSVADVFWGIGFIITAIATLIIADSYAPRQIMVTILVLLWGLRLSGRIYLRNRGKDEDWRYKKWREDWGKNFVIRSFLQVFMLQGLFLWANISPVLVIHAYSGPPLFWLDIIGILVWCLGFFFEAVGDYQLDRFMKNPAKKAKIMDEGLWRYTRHPNYFGEVTQWWGIAIIALAIQPWGWYGLLGAMTITATILFVSGIPMLEKSMVKIPGYPEYAARTSVFIPWLPKSSKSGQ